MGLQGFDLEGTGIPSEQDIVKRYCKLAGRSYPDPNWDFYIAFFFFKMTVILQVNTWFGSGVSHARVRDGHRHPASTQLFLCSRCCRALQRVLLEVLLHQLELALWHSLYPSLLRLHLARWAPCNIATPQQSQQRHHLQPHNLNIIDRNCSTKLEFKHVCGKHSAPSSQSIAQLAPFATCDSN